MSLHPERALQCWDDLDDLLGAIALRAERIRQSIVFVFFTLIFALLVAAVVTLALIEPPLALATAVLLIVTLMYRSATGRQRLEISV